MKKFYLIVNPHGGRKQGRRLLEDIRPVLKAAELELEFIETEDAGHARELANQLGFEGYHGMIVVGGDGTMHEVLNGMLNRPDQQQLPIGLIPGGSGNSLLVDLGLADPRDAARSIAAGQTRKIDVAEVQVGDDLIYAFNIIGWGLPTDIGIRAEKWRWMGPARYTIVSLFEVLRGTRARKARLILDDDKVVDNFMFVMACNTRYTGNMKIAPQARLDDGLLDVIVVRHGARRLKILTLLNRIYDGTHIDDPLVEHYAVSRFSLIPERDEILNIDGELTGTTPVTVTMRQEAFELFAPPAK